MIPLKVISWKRAMKKAVLFDYIPEEGLEVVEYYDGAFVRSAHDIHEIPAVLKTGRYIDIKSVPFNKKNIMLRDDCRCQYCGRHLHPRDMHVDHVYPRSLWTKK
jgi:hypothetical protein